METNDYQKITKNLAPMLNALSHPARLQIMLHLAKYNGCQARSISERLPLAKSTVSEHLSKLKEAGLITCDLDGTCSNYRLNDAGFELLKIFFTEFIDLVEQQRAEPQKCCPAAKLKGDTLLHVTEL
ncbi:MAG TPA: transcriptional regulator [Prolixibacteraceae bacterium]|nr:transcriptional regulator [Prolixibacteraceae bacterium]